jgi:hypothetical protein
MYIFFIELTVLPSGTLLHSVADCKRRERKSDSSKLPYSLLPISLLNNVILTGKVAPHEVQLIRMSRVRKCVAGA